MRPIPGRRAPNNRNLTNTYTANHTLNADRAHIETLLDGEDARFLLSNRVTVTTSEKIEDTVRLLFHAKRKNLQGHLNEGFIKKVTSVEGWHRVSERGKDGQKRQVHFSRNKNGVFAAEVTMERDAVKITP